MKHCIPKRQIDEKEEKVFFFLKKELGRIFNGENHKGATI